MFSQYRSQTSNNPPKLQIGRSVTLSHPLSFPHPHPFSSLLELSLIRDFSRHVKHPLLPFTSLREHTKGLQTRFCEGGWVKSTPRNFILISSQKQQKKRIEN
ncbi:hypothetical protein CDAR_45211 [Caerostris darwini]|uniref:Uncharacterized protein n=1 Tax=Caerostris darwini TaxID=1538125 RepID=A0AAV4QB39_9ARAC|nr:hypothetical protein CDAR_45211 [Caerostris darwini]